MHNNDKQRLYGILAKVGGGFAVVGFLLFLSVFVSSAMNFGNFDNFESQTRSAALRAVGGMAMIIFGVVLSGSASHRKQSQHPAGMEVHSSNDWNEGDSAKWDNIDDNNLNVANYQVSKNNSTEKVIMIKCTLCGKLNEEDSNFCQECGSKI